MKIVKAMKKVARLKGEIRELRKRMDSCLNSLIENEYSEDYISLKEELNNKTGLLIDLKTKIMHTNVTNGMFSVIVNLGELKSYLEFLKELEPKIGKQNSSRYSDEIGDYKSQLTIKEKNELVSSCQEDINQLTDQLDEFNATTDLLDIEIEKILFE